MYYCQSRYYVPELYRWLNIDNANFLEEDDINKLNLFVYCANNPVMRIDSNGTFSFKTLFRGIAIGATIIAVAAVTCTGGTAGAFVVAAGKAALTGVKIAGAAAATAGTIRAARSLDKNIREHNSFSETMENMGKSFLDGVGDGFIAGAKYFASSTIISMIGRDASGYFNNGYGYQISHYSLGYQNPNILSVTLISDLNSKFRLDLDHIHSFHYHFGKTNKERKIHKGSWIGGIFVGLFVGFQGEVY